MVWAILNGVWEFLKAMFNWVAVVPIKILEGLGEMLIGVFTLSPLKISQGFSDAKDAMFHGAMDLATSFRKGYDEGMEGFAKDHHETSLIPHATRAGKGAAIATGEKTGKEAKTKATGAKVTTINVTIQKLGETHLNVTNIKEGMAKIREAVVATLTSAVDDFQIVASH